MAEKTIRVRAGFTHSFPILPNAGIQVFHPHLADAKKFMLSLYSFDFAVGLLVSLLPGFTYTKSPTRIDLKLKGFGLMIEFEADPLSLPS